MSEASKPLSIRIHHDPAVPIQSHCQPDPKESEHMSTDTPEVKEKDVLEELAQCGYSYTQRLFDRYKGRVYFTDTGKARLGMIVGYIIGLMHAGKTELAEKMAIDIDDKLGQLSPPRGDCEVERTTTWSLRSKKLDDDGKEVVSERIVNVPSRKCVVGDDGTWHGFGLMWYRLLSTEAYEEHLAKHQADITKEREDGTDVWDTAHQRVVKALNIRERIDPNAPYSDELVEYRFLDKGQTKFYYVPGFNGGLIYHGPGAGETFTTNMGSGNLWGIHT